MNDEGDNEFLHFISHFLSFGIFRLNLSSFKTATLGWNRFHLELKGFTVKYAASASAAG